MKGQRHRIAGKGGKGARKGAPAIRGPREDEARELLRRDGSRSPDRANPDRTRSPEALHDGDPGRRGENVPPPMPSYQPHHHRRADRDGARERSSARSPREEDSASEYLIGWHPVHEALIAGSRRIGKILVSTDRHDSRVGEILELAKAARIPVRRVPFEALRRILPRGVPHQGVAAEVAPKAYTDADDLLSRIDRDTLFVVLDEIRDPRNLGAILRTAAAVACSGVFVPLHRAASLTPAASKTSAGGIESVPVARVPNLGRLLASMSEAGIVRVGLDPGANDLYTSIPGDRPLAVVLGSEERGLRPSIRSACDLLVRIPVPGRVGSLNVSVAAGIALYEVLRARAGASTGAGADAD